ncbi:MAG: toprim domain-containing protein [Mesorhizobium sp.]
MSRLDASELAIRLGRRAEAVCRQYLSNGRREGHYWLVGDVNNTPGRSMYVRLTGLETGKGAAGKWTDAAVPDAHGDLLDVIAAAIGRSDFRSIAAEARRFLSEPDPEPVEGAVHGRKPTRSGSREAARRLLAISQTIRGTIAETYLRNRGITALHDLGSLHFHPGCYYRPRGYSVTQALPAMIAAVTDLADAVTGAHRTWLAPDGAGKAAVETPRRAMGELLGNGVRFGRSGAVMAAGEGIETVLSVRSGLPRMPMIAALSAAHLAAILFPEELRRLYVIRDRDPAGNRARDRLISTATDAGIEAIGLAPGGGDFNIDLHGRGLDALVASLKDQLHPDDTGRFLGG